MGVFLLVLTFLLRPIPPCAVPIINVSSEMAGVGSTIDLASDDVHR